MNVRKRQVIADLNGTGIFVQAGAMQWIAGNIDVQTNVKGAGDLAKKLTHPSNEVQKIYHVTTDKAVSVADIEKIMEGLELEDGFIKADEVGYLDQHNKCEIGIRIHSGRNRIVRRIFEYLGYDVVKLDRIMFAGLDKKGLSRGRWRFLNDREIGFLHMISNKKAEESQKVEVFDDEDNE